MAWFDDLNLPGATIDGYFGFVQADGPDDDEYPDVVLADGTVTFTATTEAARVDGAWLGIKSVTAQIFEGRIVASEEDPRPVRLLATDADIGVEDWAWRATFDVPGVKFEPLTFKAPQGTTVNLTADLIPIKSAPYQIVKGDSIVDAEADATGRLRFEISNGSFTNWVAVPVGPHTHPLGDVTGLQAALNGKTNTTDPRLSDARPPTTHTHALGDVAGLAARLAALEQDTGLRDVRAGFPEFDFTRPGGHAHLSRIRNEVFLSLGGIPHEDAVVGISLQFQLPNGFSGESYSLRGIARTGTVTGGVSSVSSARTLNPQIPRTAGQTFQMLLHFRTSESWPTTLPGTPA